MDIHRINILGASGCGASTLGRALAGVLRVPHVDSDDYYHAPTDPPFQTQRSPDERCALLTADLLPTGNWVLSGGVAGWEPYPQLDFTLIVFLWVPAATRIARLRQREHQRFGERIGVGGDMHDAHEAFIAWASRYDTGDVDGKTLARHEAYLAQQTCRVLAIRDAVSVTTALRRVLAAVRAQ